jgi:hypothetical protein
MAIIVPLVAVPRQTVQVVLGGQSCEIEVFQTDFGLYMNLSVQNAPIVQGMVCLNLVRIVRRLYLGFLGDLVFQDIEDDTDPVYTGLGTRYFLNYIPASALPAGVG